MKKMVMTGALLCALMPLTGCYKSTFVYSSKAPTANTMEETRSYGFFGLSKPDKPFRADAVCGASSVAKVEQFASFGNSCLTAITLNIYTPRTIRVTCGSGQAHNFYLDEHDTVLAHEQVDAQTGDQHVETFSSDAF